MSGFQQREFHIMTDSDATMSSLDDTDDETEHLLWQRDELNSKPPKKSTQIFTPATNHKFGAEHFLAHEYLSDEVSEEVRTRRRSLAFNLIALSGIFLLQTIALPLYDIRVVFMNVNDTQLITICSLSLYCSTIFSGLIAPFIILRYDAKIPILAGCAGTAIFVCSKFAPHPSLVIPGAVIAGLGEGLFLGGVGTSLISIASLYSSYGGGAEEFVQYIFCGLANMWVLAAPVWNSIMQLLIEAPHEEPDNKVARGAAYPAEDCGLHFTWKWDHGAVVESDQDVVENLKIQAMLGTHLACVFCAVLITCFCLEPVTSRVFPNEVCQVKGSPQCWMFHDKAAGLIVPSFVVIGCLQFFWFSIFLQAVGECSLSMAGALYLIIITSSSSLLFAAPIGLLLKSAGRVKCVMFAILCDTVIFILILCLDKWHISVYIVTCILRGMAEAIYHTAFSGMLPLIYKESSNFAIVHFLTYKNLGYLLMFIIIRLGASILVSVVISLVLIGMFVGTYIPMEILVRLREEKDKQVVHKGVLQTSGAKSWLPNLGPLAPKLTLESSVQRTDDMELQDAVVSNKWSE